MRVALMTEAALQASVVQWLNLKRIEYRVGLEGVRLTIGQRRKMKAQGMGKGWPDIMIFEKRGQYSGLAIELKWGKNKPTPEQKEKLAYLESQGWKTAVHRNFDDVKREIEAYLALDFEAHEAQLKRENEYLDQVLERMDKISESVKERLGR